MASEQGAGGGIESNRRHMSTSAAENEPIQENEEQNNNLKPTPPKPEESQFTQPPQGLPRHINSGSNVATPSHAGVPMSRAPSSGSSVGTPSNSAEVGYFEHSHSSKPPRPALPLDPPVTKSTLSELDVSKIVHNPKLRHDINFDPELHFRPNVDGEKGRKKEDKADHFWSTLQKQLIAFVLDRESFYETYGTNDDWCLPQLLKTVKGIIQTLVPERDRPYLEEGLNVELLMQQFNKGTADLEKLASWLSSVLKSHCAPMRDEWVDRMYEKLSSGNRNNDIEELALGMRALLEVLEAMKLDVANHQIRCLRPVLIENTVHFEQRFFMKRIQQRRLDIDSSRQWYRDAEQRYAGTVSSAAAHSFGDMAFFFEAMSKLVRPSVQEKDVPNTFLFDEERFLKLRSDMLDAVNLEVCMRLYEDHERLGSFLSGSFSFQMDEEPVVSRTPSPFAFDFNTPPSGSRPSSLAISSGGSDTSSPRSSVVIPSQTASSSPDSAEAKLKARKLHSSLVALIQSFPPTSSRHESRWAAMAPSIALQIFRHLNAPLDMLPNFEAKVLAHVTNVHNATFREVEDQLQARLLSELQRRVHHYRGLTGVALFSVATGGRINGPGRTWDAGQERCSGLRDVSAGAGGPNNRDTREAGSLEDMAMRMAHLGILHWRVWAPLVYIGDGSGLSGEMPAPGLTNV